MTPWYKLKHTLPVKFRNKEVFTVILNSLGMQYEPAVRMVTELEELGLLLKWQLVCLKFPHWKKPGSLLHSSRLSEYTALLGQRINSQDKRRKGDFHHYDHSILFLTCCSIFFYFFFKLWLQHLFSVRILQRVPWAVKNKYW